MGSALVARRVIAGDPHPIVVSAGNPVAKPGDMDEASDDRPLRRCEGLGNRPDEKRCWRVGAFGCNGAGCGHRAIGLGGLGKATFEVVGHRIPGLAQIVGRLDGGVAANLVPVSVLQEW